VVLINEVEPYGVCAQNHRMMRNFRFALVMENSYSRGYVTEKIANAFIGGRCDTL
jgi:hypothetical protein